MGDRRNIVVDHGNGASVALYTHWDGSEAENMLATALDRGRSRWMDSPYLTRIIFSEMIQHSVLNETGHGIEPFITGHTSYCEAAPDTDLFVQIPSQTVKIGDQSWPFEDFINTYKSS